MATVPLVGTALPQQHGGAWLPPSSEPRTSQGAVKNTIASGTPMIVTVLGAMAGTLVTLVVLMYLYWRFLRQPKLSSTGQYTTEGGSRAARHASEGVVAAVESRPHLMQGAEHLPTTFPVVVIEPDKTIKIAVEDTGTILSDGAASGLVAMFPGSPPLPLPVVTVAEGDHYASQAAGRGAGPQPFENYSNQQEGLGLQEGGRQQQPQHGEQQLHEQQQCEQHGRHHAGHQQQQPRLAPVIARRQLPSMTAGRSDDGELCVAYEEQERRRREHQAVQLARSFNRVPIFPGWSLTR
ncbi:hypothetical protein N2152v2_001524 [Parachlorella kessleri]